MRVQKRHITLFLLDRISAVSLGFFGVDGGRDRIPEILDDDDDGQDKHDDDQRLEEEDVVPLADGRVRREEVRDQLAEDISKGHDGHLDGAVHKLKEQADVGVALAGLGQILLQVHGEDDDDHEAKRHRGRITLVVDVVVLVDSDGDHEGLDDPPRLRGHLRGRVLARGLGLLDQVHGLVKGGRHSIL